MLSSPSQHLINLTLCEEANEIHVQWGMILTQIFVVIINLSSTIVTGVFAQFVFGDKTKHVNYRALLISVTVAVSLRAATTLARALRVLAFIAINEVSVYNF
uniref:Uncharacterized protein n=1 Tax=Panagrolaimus sp. ES5 TaxID=591445 RepID=A0AC34GVV8_9BILA